MNDMAKQQLTGVQHHHEQQLTHTAIFKLLGETTKVHRIIEVEGLSYSRAQAYFNREAQNMADKYQMEILWDWGFMVWDDMGAYRVQPSNWVLVVDMAM